MPLARPVRGRPWKADGHTDTQPARTPLFAYPRRRGDASGSAMAPFTVCGRASLCHLALIAARERIMAGRGKGRTCGGTGDFGIAGAVPFVPGRG